MRKLQFHYFMEIHYSVPVATCHYTIKCFPIDNMRQRISKVKICLYPESEPQWEYDSFGNRYIFGCNQIPHDTFRFEISGSAECGLADHEMIAGENDEMIHRHPHGLNTAGEKLTDYFEKLCAAEEFRQCQSVLETSEYFMHALHRDFCYEQGVTDMNTTAEGAFALGKGVCQDYAHILISLLQMCGFSARYVTGFLIGEGKSHAWTEVLSDGRWYGFDATNDKRVTDEYIRIGSGRDAADCLINRGIMHGGGDQTQDIQVSVYEAYDI